MSGEPSDEPTEARFARLISVIRHELLGPLAIIGGFADLLPTDDAELEARAVEAIRRNTSLATLLVDRLRDADDIVAGEDLQVERTETDVAELVADTVGDVAGTLLVDHEVELDLPDGAAVAPVDGDRVRQVLFNLLSNAAKYSEPDSAIAIEVRSRGGMVEVAVTNDGDGIAPEDVDRAFEAFTRLTDDEDGTGLGLAISRAIARAHDGDLTAHPAPDGPGARFLLSLPGS